MNRLLHFVVLCMALLCGAPLSAQTLTYGPYAEWTAASYTELEDGTGRLLWNRNIGQVNLWRVDHDGHYAGHTTFAPRSGYAAESFANDEDRGYLLWAHESGQADLWTLDDQDLFLSRVTHDPDGDWQPVHYDHNGSRGRLLWANGLGQASLWFLSNSGTYYRHVLYGPERDTHRSHLHQPPSTLSANQSRTGVAAPVSSFRGTLDTANVDGRGHYILGTADVTGDGKADLVSSHTNGNAYVWPGQDNGTFGNAVSSFNGTLNIANLDGSGHYIVGLADVTGDGKADLVSTHSNGNAYVWPGRSDGHFGNAISSFRGTLDTANVDGRGHYILGLADVNGDGRADLVSRHTNGNAYVWSGSPAGLFSGARSSFRGTLDIANQDNTGHLIVGIADVDGDKRADLISVHANNHAYVWPGRSDNTFGTAKSIFQGTLNTSNIDGDGHYIVGASDMNGDGRADLVSVGADGKTYVWDGRTDGTFSGNAVQSETDVNIANLGGAGHFITGLADVNGDGKSDLVSAHDNGNAYVFKGLFDVQQQDWTVRSVELLEDGQMLMLWTRADGLTETRLLDAEGNYLKHQSEVLLGETALSLQAMPDGRTFRLSMGADRTMKLDMLHVRTRDAFERIQDAYFSNDGERYHTLLKHEFRIARRSLGELCVERLSTLAEISCDGSLDGLESLAMVYHDCVVTSDDAGLQTAHGDALHSLTQCGQFVQSPKPNLDIFFALYNGLSMSGVRPEAVREVFDHLMDRPINELSELGLLSLLESDAMNAELCALPTRNNEQGVTSIEDIARLVACRMFGRPGGIGVLGAMCEIVTQECTGCGQGDGAGPVFTGNVLNQVTTANSTAHYAFDTRPLTLDEANRFEAFCSNVEGIIPGGGGGENIGGFNHAACFEIGHTEESLRDMRIVESITACLGDGSGGNPFASESVLPESVENAAYVARLLAQAAQLVAEGAAGGVGGLFSWGIGVVLMGISMYEAGATLTLQNRLAKAGCRTMTMKCGEHNKCQYLPDEPGCPGAMDGTGVQTPMGSAPENDGSGGTGGSGGSGGMTGSGGMGGSNEPMPEPSSSNGAGNPAEPGPTPDLSNPACRELANMGLINGKGEEFWDEFFNRQPGRDPRKENVHPDDIRYDESADDIGCGGRAQSDTARCNAPILCSEGTVLDPETCSCISDLGTLNTSQVCASTRCGPNQVAIPIAMQVCICQDTDQGGDIPPTGPIDPRHDGSGVPGEELPGGDGPNY